LKETGYFSQWQKYMRNKNLRKKIYNLRGETEDIFRCCNFTSFLCKNNIKIRNIISSHFKNYLYIKGIKDKPAFIEKNAFTYNPETGEYKIMLYER
jgi:hypothetical protein